MSNSDSCCGSEKPKKEESCCGGNTEMEKPAATSSCCGTAPAKPAIAASCCGTPNSQDTSNDADGGCCAPADKGSIDWILWTCAPAVLLGYIGFLVFGHSIEIPWVNSMLHTSYEMVNAMWWGILSAAFFVGLLGRIPRELIMSVLGRGGSKTGVLRATIAGLLLDLCNHGILMVAMKLYERGASIGQVMAFLIASPWNSLTLTLILIGLIGLPWTLAFIAGSLVIAWVSGWIFDILVERGTLPANPNSQDFEKVDVWPTLKATWASNDWALPALAKMFWGGLKESKMVLRWVVFGVVLVALIRAFVPEDIFSVWFGATAGGLLLTLLAASVIEVCSEGSSPIAADLLTRAAAPGNAFTFLMAGAATDYTEVMVLKDTTKSWKIALFLPLVTVPQVLLIGWLMNLYGV
ncbi:MAG: ATPase [Thalassobium sp.]|uniref:permease n=1 Tax=Thalassolituus oleivorans TaxID=187493 RepID=UPI000949241D|nr:permease [Thalassolituus oleivorans]APR67475.1 ATPase [Thalassolituus oleivorans]PCI47886.1 MAG: ATPase [Oceanospirillales bacterium]PHQ87505.1 MAG: ATPase [Thalassobium sp.]